ncbi:MAG TPA: hypothetical protein VL261_12570 [Nitrospira sp.]|nr:hypothetical protein [Nitrospira sp.]
MTKHASPSSVSWCGTPLTFVLAGFTWLALSFVLGMGLLIGLVDGTPLPQWLKPLHVHGALVGGILQLAIGSLLLWIVRVSERHDGYAQTHPALFLTLNGGTAALLLGFWLGSMTAVGLAGLLLSALVLSISKTAWTLFGKAADAGGMYRVAQVALLCGLAAGVAMAFRLTGSYSAHARLTHIHLIVLGFATLSCLVAVHQLMPLLTGTPVSLGPVRRFALWLLPVGFAVLLAAFLASALWLQIAAGCLLLVSIGLCSDHLAARWFKGDRQGTAATDHLLTGVFFLVLVTAAGVGMAANYLSNPPLLPIGSLHLMAYTHLAFIGFMTQVVCGGVSFVVPEVLARTRVPNTAKREVYRATLDAIMNRWRAFQLIGMSLGTMALCVLASLTWNLPLSSSYVQGTVWIATGLMVSSLTLFAAKLAWVVGLRPS